MSTTSGQHLYVYPPILTQGTLTRHLLLHHSLGGSSVAVTVALHHDIEITVAAVGHTTDTHVQVAVHVRVAHGRGRRGLQG